MRNHQIKILCLCLAATFLGACSTTYKIDQKLVDAFEDIPVEQDKTGVYIIRGSKFQGGARGAWIAVNDNVVADLSNGSHVFLNLTSGLNTIHGVQGTAGFGYTTADNRPGETVFLELDYTTAGISEIDPALGKTMVAKTKAREPLAEPRNNDAIDNQLLTPGVLGYPIMIPATDKLMPGADAAVVTFYRTSRLIPDSAFDIWSQDGYIGSTKGDTYFQAKLKPGKHTFVSISEQYSLLEADLEAGKEYAVELSVGMGWNQAHVKLLPVDLNDNKEYEKSIAKAQPRALDMNVVQSAAIAQRIQRGFPLVAAALEKRQAGDLDARTLPGNFGR